LINEQNYALLSHLSITYQGLLRALQEQQLVFAQALQQQMQCLASLLKAREKKQELALRELG